MKVGLVGCGNISETYFNCQKIFNNFEITTCADIDQEAADKSAKEHNVKVQTVDASGLISDWSQEKELFIPRLVKSVQSIPGYSFEDCIPFSGDDINWTPTWKDGKTLDALSGRAIRIEVQLNSSRLYAIRGDFVNMLGQQKRAFDNDGTVPVERPGF